MVTDASPGTLNSTLNNVFFVSERKAGRAMTKEVWRQWTGVNWSSVQVHRRRSTHGCVFCEQLVGWAVGLQGAIFRTADGGATWVSQFTDTTRTFRAVHFTDAAFGWAVGVRVTGVNNTVYKTTNGGSSWTNVSMADPNVFANDVVFTDPNTGFVVGGLSGGQAVVFTTVDGGETWGRQTVSGVTASQFFALAVVSESTGVDGWVVGEGDDQVVAMTLDPYCSAVTTCATDTECAYGDACIATDIPYYHLNRSNSCASDCQRPGDSAATEFCRDNSKIAMTATRRMP